ncbi:sensor histidine kinase [Bauldia litoralis]|uniref:sensor histidine kinase n=1 Tax=Bauldia litoralis TaxID=665467 RepID=UPI00326519BF
MSEDEARSEELLRRIATLEQALARSEARFRAFTDAVPHHVWTSRPDGMLDWFNPRVYEYSGAKEGELDGEGWAAIVHPDDLAAAAKGWAEALVAGQFYQVEFRLRRHDGVYRHHIARAVPIYDRSGTLVQWIGTNTDIDDQMRDAQALRQSETRLKLAQYAAGIAAIEIDIEAGTISGSEAFWEMWGLSPREKAPLAMFEAMVVPEDQHLRSNARNRADGTASPSAEYRIRRGDTGEIRWLARHIDFTRSITGTPTRMFGVIQDITERKQAEARQEMLTHELEHRIKNILATVSAIASKTLRNTDLDSAREALAERLRALANAHDILTFRKWTEASVAEVVESTLSVFAKQTTVTGPSVSLDPKKALSLALAVNELATNAQKYGALSVEDGRVEVLWRIDDEAAGGPQFTWSWREIGGPEVSPPTRQGFGTFLIERVLAADFGGSVRIEYAPDGVECVLTAPPPTPLS